MTSLDNLFGDVSGFCFPLFILVTFFHSPFIFPSVVFFFFFFSIDLLDISLASSFHILCVVRFLIVNIFLCHVYLTIV